MTQSFVPDDAVYSQDVDVINDYKTHGDEITYPGASTQETDHASIVATPHETEQVFEEYPGRFVTDRTPIVPRIGRTRTRTINVFGNGAPMLAIGRNMNRSRLLVWTDINNTVPITVSCRETSQGAGVALAPNSQPVEFRTFYEFYVWSTVNGLLYVVEEEWYVNGEGR